MTGYEQQFLDNLNKRIEMLNGQLATVQENLAYDIKNPHMDSYGNAYEKMITLQGRIAELEMVRDTFELWAR